MRYIGSKAWCVEKLQKVVKKEMPLAASLCDPFAGTCTVAMHFKKLGFSVDTGDMLAASFILQTANVKLNKPPTFKALANHIGLNKISGASAAEKVISFLNKLPGKAGWVTKAFSLRGSQKRKFFTIENAMRIDAIRERVHRWRRKGWISKSERAYILACLLYAIDKVASTTGTYYAYLKCFYRKAKKRLKLTVITPCNNKKLNRSFLGSAELLVKKTNADILYLDPPYNQRDYGAYYHIPEMIAKGTTPRVYGKSGHAKKSFGKSPFCSASNATKALRSTINQANGKLIILHYAYSGLVKHSDIMDILRAKGRTRCTIWKTKSYLAKSSSARKAECGIFRTRVYVCHPQQEGRKT